MAALEYAAAAVQERQFKSQDDRVGEPVDAFCDEVAPPPLTAALPARATWPGG